MAQVIFLSAFFLKFVFWITDTTDFQTKNKAYKISQCTVFPLFGIYLSSASGRDFFIIISFWVVLLFDEFNILPI